jgi:hypothetical protein
LKFILKIAKRSDPSNNEVRFLAFCKIYEQTFETRHLDMGEVLGHGAEHRHSLIDRKGTRFGRVVEDRDDQVIDEFFGSSNQI